jgi:hypothetical protein
MSQEVLQNQLNNYKYIVIVFEIKSYHLSDGEIWTAHGGVNPRGLVVRWGDRELRTRWLC